MGASLILLISNLLLPPEVVIPRSILLVDAVLSLMAITILRFAYRTWMEVISPALSQSQRSPTLIYGVGSESIGILQMLSAMHSSRLPFRVVGFVADTPKHQNSLIAEFPFIGLRRAGRKSARRRRPVTC